MINYNIFSLCNDTCFCYFAVLLRDANVVVFSPILSFLYLGEALSWLTQIKITHT